MSDRRLQDEVIRYLADATVRAATGIPTIPAAEAVKAGRFANFLARRYYRDRLARSFRYSHRFRAEIGRTAAQVVDSEEFDEFLQECVLGSLVSAKRMAGIATQFLDISPSPAPWWTALVEYECAYFLQAATAERSAAPAAPAQGVSAACVWFGWNLPVLLRRLRSETLIDGDLRSPSTLLFSRTDAGRIYVVEAEENTQKVFLACDGRRGIAEIATAAEVAPSVAAQAIASLAEIGAIVVPPTKT